MAGVIEEPLTGGNVTESVVRVGDTVRRSRGAGSAFASRVLVHLESVGFAHAPRFLGVDEQGRDVLDFVPGRTTDHPSQRAVGAYRLGARMLKALHEATAGHALAGSEECVIHGDPGPYNTVFREGLPVVLIDWDAARPGRAIDDVGFMAWTWCLQVEGNVPIAEQAAHLREFSDGYGNGYGSAYGGGYGDVEPERLIEAMLRRQAEVAVSEAAKATDERLSPQRRRHAKAAAAWAADHRRLVEENRCVLLSALE
ncbi:phosphotransferase [Glycomyces paridis]|uniref:phosphotransferase n=1 Tax=Glycomyces paridis TaxID=2126555 RepID=UPI00195C460C|nr:phosphotransferase [Glycomyces paridis]